MPLKLIELIRQTRDRGHRYCAVDADGEAYSYDGQPDTQSLGPWWKYNDGINKYIGTYKFSCDRKYTLIDVDKIKVK